MKHLTLDMQPVNTYGPSRKGGWVLLGSSESCEMMFLGFGVSGFGFRVSGLGGSGGLGGLRAYLAECLGPRLWERAEFGGAVAEGITGFLMVLGGGRGWDAPAPLDKHSLRGTGMVLLYSL